MTFADLSPRRDPSLERNLNIKSKVVLLYVSKPYQLKLWQFVKQWFIELKEKVFRLSVYKIDEKNSVLCALTRSIFLLIARDLRSGGNTGRDCAYSTTKQNHLHERLTHSLFMVTVGVEDAQFLFKSTKCPKMTRVNLHNAQYASSIRHQCCLQMAHEYITPSRIKTVVSWSCHEQMSRAKTHKKNGCEIILRDHP